jgi:hypothetical protein
MVDRSKAGGSAWELGSLRAEFRHKVSVDGKQFMRTVALKCLIGELMAVCGRLMQVL